MMHLCLLQTFKIFMQVLLSHACMAGMQGLWSKSLASSIADKHAHSCSGPQELTTTSSICRILSLSDVGFQDVAMTVD